MASKEFMADIWPQIEKADTEKSAERLTLYVRGVMEITVKNEINGGKSHDEQARV